MVSFYPFLALKLDRHGGIGEVAGDLRLLGRSENFLVPLHLNQRHVGGTNKCAGLPAQRFGVILAAKDCATIFPSRTTNVSVAASYELSAVSALHNM